MIVHVMQGSGVPGTLPTSPTILETWRHPDHIPRVGELIVLDRIQHVDGRMRRVTDVLWMDPHGVQVYVAP